MVGTTVVQLTLPGVLSKLANGRALIQNRTADLIFKINGLNPVAEDLSTGQVLYKPATLEVVGIEMRNLRMVRATAMNSAVHVRYEQRLG